MMTSSRERNRWWYRLGLPLMACALALGTGSGAGVTRAADDTEGSKGSSDEKAESAVPQIELHIPTMKGLVEGARSSKTGRLYAALADVAAVPTDETGEGLDIGAIFKLLTEIGQWPDTSLTMTTYSQDREGRARWAICVDWSARELRSRIESLVKHEAASKLLKDVVIRDEKGAQWRVELSGVLLGVIKRHGSGSMLASSADLRPPETVFGQRAAGSGDGRRRSLLYCRLNLEAAEKEEGSAFAGFSAVKDVRFGMSVDAEGLWNERLNVTWNPLLGTVVKAALSKVERPFACPNESYLDAAFNLGMLGLPELLTGVDAGGLSDKLRGESALSVVAGDGFLPIPDIYWQFHARRKERVIEALRAHLKKDAERRRANEQDIAWRETEVEGETVFWRDPGADGPRGILPVTFRTVVFFSETRQEDAERRTPILVVAQTSTSAEDAVRRWTRRLEKRSAVSALPESKEIHWQARVRWERIYGLLQPYLSMLAGLAEGAALPPTAEALKGDLSDAQLNIRIEFAGLDVRHKGPIPLGVVYVPAVTAMSFESSGSPNSEAERERVACRNLRVLHHHAALFKKDFGRWPATVAELDGYIDFRSHPELLWLWPKQRSFLEGLTSGLLAKGGPEKKKGEEEEERAIDDSLYVIDWSPEEWRLAFREGEFKEYATIAIDAEGEIHRSPKTESKDETKARTTEGSSGRDDSKKRTLD